VLIALWNANLEYQNITTSTRSRPAVRGKVGEVEGDLEADLKPI
jgi:hypothetical protein